jgi:hypothetical protein
MWAAVRTMRRKGYPRQNMCFAYLAVVSAVLRTPGVGQPLPVRKIGACPSGYSSLRIPKIANAPRTGARVGPIAAAPGSSKWLRDEAARALNGDYRL